MESNHVNFNYEYDLFSVPIPAWMNRTLKPSMECLYFYCDESLPLATDLEYDSDFLSQVNGSVVAVSDSSHSWWGQINELAKLTNSKITNYEINKKLNLWTPKGGVAHSWEEVDTLMGEGRWRLKDPLLMGGTGQWRIDRTLLHEPPFKKGIEDRLKKGPLLLEQSLDISRVLGTTFQLIDESFEILFTVENHLNSQGNFLGGEIVETPKEIAADLIKMAKYWHTQGARGIFEIDSFEHAAGWFPCVEVNHRKTMGWFIWKLTKKFGSGRMSLEKSGGIRLNPQNAPLPVEWVSF